MSLSNGVTNHHLAIRFWAKAAYILIVQLFTPALAFVIEGPVGIIVTMGAHYLATNLVAWTTHFHLKASPWVKILLSFGLLTSGGIILILATFESQISLVITASILFGSYEALFWSSYHKIREDADGNGPDTVSRWNIFEKVVAFSLLLSVAIVSKFSSSLIFMSIGVIAAGIGATSTISRISKEGRGECVSVNDREHCYSILMLPFLEGVLTALWVLYMRLLTLSGGFDELSLIGSGAPGLAKVMAISAIIGALSLRFDSDQDEVELREKNHRQWKVTIGGQIILLIILLCNTNVPLQFLTVVLMGAFQARMFGQSVYTIRDLLAHNGASSHDLRERMKFSGRMAGLYFSLPALLLTIKFLTATSLILTVTFSWILKRVRNR